MFKGFTDKQKEVISQPLRKLTIYTGAVRSGKSFLSYFDIPRLIDEFGVKARGIILGKTLGTIQENIIRPMKELFGDKCIGDIHSDATGNRYVTIFGCNVRCVGANDKKSEGKIRGATYAWAVCDEVSMYPELVFDVLMARLSEPNAKCVCTTNPENPNHWFKVRFIDNLLIDKAVYTFTIFDNPTLTQEYIDQIQSVYKGTELYDRLILGQWVSSIGAIYKKFIAEESAFVVDNVDARDIVDISIGIDFGENTSATTFVCTGLKRNYAGIIPLVAERITEHGDVRLLQEQFIKFVKKCIAMGWRPNNAYYDCAQWTLGRSLESAVINAGISLRVQPCVKDEILERIKLELVLIGAYKLKVLKGCTQVIDALKNAQWESHGAIEVRQDIIDKNNPVDILDALEYSFQKWSDLLLKMTLYGGNR